MKFRVSLQCNGAQFNVPVRLIQLEKITRYTSSR